MHTLVQRLVSLGEAASFNTAQLCQVHQLFVGCSVEPRLRMQAVNVWALKETGREAFECNFEVSSVSDPAASERDSAPIGAVGGGRGSLLKVGVFHRHGRRRGAR